MLKYAILLFNALYCLFMVDGDLRLICSSTEVDFKVNCRISLYLDSLSLQVVIVLNLNCFLSYKKYVLSTKSVVQGTSHKKISSQIFSVF